MNDASKAVFLSYASQDAEAARRICEALREAGVEVWFDQSELRGGDAWDAKIRKQIKECALFVPVISANTQARREGYFRLEWRLADQRTHLLSHDTPFVLPVVTDETREPEARVPESFLAVQWTRLSGQNAPAFAARVKELLRGSAGTVSNSNEAASRELNDEVHKTDAHPPRRVSASRWAWIAGGIALLAAGIGGFIVFSPRIGETPAKPAETTTAAVAPVADEKSLVVLPLENQSPEPENAFFTDGMHSEMISLLQQRVDVRVISRASALEFKPTTPVREAGARLGVAHAISGNVRRGGGKVRIQLELRRTRDEALLWTQTFNRDVADVIAVQTEIAAEVARVLQARERKGWKASAEVMTKNPEALDLYMKASQQFLDSELRGNYADLAAMVETALRLDPEFMPAAGLLSSIRINQFRTTRDSELRAFHAAEAKRWAERASQLVPGGAGDSALAAYYFRIAGDPVRALALMDSVVRALPNDSAPLNRRAIALGRLGRAAEGISDYAAALTLDPLNPLIHGNRLLTLAMLRRQGEFDRALAEAEGLLSVAPRSTALARFILAGELPPAGEFPVEERALWLAAAGRFDELLALARTELAVPNLTGADELAWQLREALALQRLQRFSEAKNRARRALELANSLRTEPEIEPGEKDRRLAQALACNERPDEAITAQRRAIKALSAERVAERWQAEIALARLCAEAGRARECVETLAPLLRVPCGLTVPMLSRDAAWDHVREDAGFKALLGDPKNSAPL